MTGGRAEQGGGADGVVTAPALVLRPPAPEDEQAARSAHAALAPEGFDFVLGGGPDDWDATVRALARERQGLDLPPGRVRHTFLLGWVGETLVGRVSVRHELTAGLRAVGGHVGYGVVPAHRRRGHASTMLRLALGLLAADGATRALVTCDEGNAGSETTIRRVGGVFENAVGQGPGPAKLRFWVPVPAPTPAEPAAGGVVVRDVRDADVPLLEQHLQGGPAHAHHRERARFGERDHLVALAEDGTPLGTAQVRWHGFGQPTERAAAPHLPEIAGVQVHPDHRSRGVGSALLAEAERRIALFGHPAAALGVGVDNPRAQALYERRGYRDTGARSTLTYRYVDEAGVTREATEHDAVLVRKWNHPAP